ncbi:hypothetical protein BGZ58_005203, partial [Dissophora ornata]
MSTSPIINHLKKAHGITAQSGVNDGTMRQGPLDAMFNASKHPKTFSAEAFDDCLVRFVVLTKQPFAIVQSQDLQELLNQAHLSSSAGQIKLPSNDTMAEKTTRKYLKLEERVIAMLAS